MTDRPDVPTYQWQVRIKRDLECITVYAAYHNQEFDFIVFKDGQHKVTYSVAADQVLDIGRVPSDPRHAVMRS